MPAAVKLNASLKPLFALPLSKTQNGRCCCSIVSLCFFFSSVDVCTAIIGGVGSTLVAAGLWRLCAFLVVRQPRRIFPSFFFPHLQLLSCLCCHRASERTPERARLRAPASERRERASVWWKQIYRDVELCRRVSQTSTLEAQKRFWAAYGFDVGPRINDTLCAASWKEPLLAVGLHDLHRLFKMKSWHWEAGDSIKVWQTFSFWAGFCFFIVFFC